MKISLANLKSWVPEVGGLEDMEVDLENFTPAELMFLLETMGDRFVSSNTGQIINLSFDRPLTAKQYKVLTQYIENNPDRLPFSHLRLRVNEEIASSGGR